MSADASDSRYEEHPPPVDVGAVAVCTWSRTTSGSNVLTVLPDGCVDLVWRSDGCFFVAGPDAGPAVHHHAAGVSFDGIRLRTGMAGTVLGVAADEVRDQQIDLRSVWGPVAEHVADQLASSPSAHDRRLALAGVVRNRMRTDAPPDAQVLAVVDELAVGGTGVGGLAERVGLSERQLHRRMLHQVGYGPKTLERIYRFRRFLDLRDGVRSGRCTLAWAAAAAGYADQSHLTRECRRLAGSTPGAMLRSDAGSGV